MRTAAPFNTTVVIPGLRQEAHSGMTKIEICRHGDLCSLRKAD
jgi:hypothetical protein